MSWLFGLNKGQSVELPEVPVLGSEDGQGGGGSAGGGVQGIGGGGNDGYRSEAYSFDSTALERAAKAAKDLEKSKFATQVRLTWIFMFNTVLINSS